MSAVCRSIAGYGFMTFLPLHLARAGHDVGFGGFVVSAYLTAGALGAFLGGWLADRAGCRAVIVRSLFGGLPLFAAYPFLPGPWAIPAIGFVGTVRGLAGAFGMASSLGEGLEMTAFTKQASDQLNIAFDCTLVALLLSLMLMYLVHTVQRAEETLVVDAQEYCQEHLLLRLYDPTAEPASRQ